ncbi:MAG: hypothetical protein FJX62_07760 [Alphaproteobacteria bacterium]|nr:hypothetical protein [Alphaproteobacteria bacterium]
MICKSIPLVIAALGVAFTTANSASAQSLGKLGNSLNRGQPTMQTGNWGPTIQVRDMGRGPGGPVTKPPGWQPSFQEKSAGLKGYVDRGQPLTKTDGKSGVSWRNPSPWPERRPRPNGPHDPQSFSEKSGKLKDYLGQSQPLSQADNSSGIMKAPPKYHYPKDPKRPPRNPGQTLSDAGKKLDTHLGKGQTMTRTDGSTGFGVAPVKHRFPPPLRNSGGTPKPTFTDRSEKLKDYLDKGQPMTTADSWTPTLSQSGDGYFQPPKPIRN